MIIIRIAQTTQLELCTWTAVLLGARSGNYYPDEWTKTG